MTPKDGSEFGQYFSTLQLLGWKGSCFPPSQKRDSAGRGAVRVRSGREKLWLVVLPMFMRSLRGEKSRASERKPGDTGKGKAAVSFQGHGCVSSVPVPTPPGPLTGALSSFCTMYVSGASALKSPSFNFHVTIFIRIAGPGCALPAARLSVV